MTMWRVAMGWTVFAMIVAFAGGFSWGYLQGYQRDEEDRSIARQALIEHCDKQDGLASTIHTEEQDIEVCVSGSHRMQKMQ
jgi:predicted negative regulator of RcsB-dependent stress response